jgi:RNA polymerase sigma-70 factor (ECF subfamily)
MAAEEEFVRLYRGRVVTMMRARMRHETIADDLAQDALLESLKSLRRGAIAEPEKLGAFVRGTALNVLNSYLRSRGRRPTEVEITEQIPDLRSPEEAARKLEALGVACRALRRLSREDREVIRMSVVEGLSASEIAAALGSNADLIRVRKCRALKRLSRGVEVLNRRGLEARRGKRRGRVGTLAQLSGTR